MLRRRFLTIAVAAGAVSLVPAALVVGETVQAKRKGEGNMDQPATRSLKASYERVTSADGATIAYERRGSGPALILVGGALNDRQSPIAGIPLAELLADDFTVYAYDRRGRGDSDDKLPYGVDRELEDLAALIAEAGTPACLFGHSSGGALALEAAIAGLPVSRLAIYEPPYSMDAAAEADSKAFAARLTAMLSEGRSEDALVFWMTETGMPPDMLEGMRQSPFWQSAQRMAPTLAYDVEVMRRGGDSFVPRQLIEGLRLPVLAMAGGDSPDWMRDASRSVADSAPGGSYLEFPGQDHMVPAEVVAPELTAFFLAG
jgi:pimeloyl-ACP methyl ester carboxylesterase